MEEKRECKLACDFRLREKLYAQFTFIAMGILGTIGIILEDWIWITPYVVIYWYGIPGVVMRHLTCPRCPHLHKYGDCLQFPVFLTRTLVKARKTTSFSVLEKLLFYMIFILIPIYPIYWLLSRPVIFASFLLLAVMWYSGQFFYFCRRCRVSECPFNRVAVTQ